MDVLTIIIIIINMPYLMERLTILSITAATVVMWCVANARRISF